jgi:hypothetical protein
MRVRGKMNKLAMCGKNTGTLNNKQVIGIIWEIHKLNLKKNCGERSLFFCKKRVICMS